MEQIPIGERMLARLNEWFETAVVMLPNLVVAVIVIGFGAFAARWVSKAVSSVLRRVTDNEPISELLATLARIATILVSLFVALGLLQLDRTVTSLLAGVGVVGLALGFAFQDIAANFMAGFLMALRRPFDVGDQVEIGGHHGAILRINLRSTELETLDGLWIMVPNRDVFQSPIVNYTHTPRRRLELEVGTAYGDDMEKVRDVILGAVHDVPLRDREREVEVFFNAFGDSSINSTVRIWLTESTQREYLHAKSEAMIAIKKAFDREGITIPFPIRTLDFGAGVVGGERLDQMRIRR
jgi:small conductance mechanosensitive channel